MDSGLGTYNDSLIITATLTLESGSFSVSSGSIIDLELNLNSWGFEGSIEFLVMAYPQKDGLLSAFEGTKPIPISVSVETNNMGTEQSSAVPLTISGVVSQREFVEVTGNQQATTLVKQNPVLYRRYRAGIMDPARYYWKMHFLQAIYSNSTYKTIISSQQVSAINLAMSWDFLTTKYTQVFINAGAGLARGKTASFYDFLIWLVDTNNGYWYYNYSNKQYNISSSAQSGGTTQNLSTLGLGVIKISPGQPKLSTLTVMNAVASGSTTKTITNSNAVSPLRNDYVTIQPIPSDFTSFTTLQTNRFQGSPVEVSWGYVTTPLVMPMPGVVIQFETQSNNLSTSSVLSGQKLSIKSVRLHAQQIMVERETDSYGASNAGFVISLEADAIDSSTKLSFLPDFISPIYPIRVQGTVYSEQGASSNLTYAFSQAQGSSEKYYQVQIPVWNNIKIQVPYQPVNMNGQFYFPPYKNEQVLVELGLTTSVLVSYLDWRSNAILPLDTQGNMIVLGQTDTSCTTIKHSYTNNQPQLDIYRQLSSDTETISMGEGFILLQTKENSSS